MITAIWTKKKKKKKKHPSTGQYTEMWCIYNDVVLSNKRQQTSNVCDVVDKCQKHYTEPKPDMEESHFV